MVLANPNLAESLAANVAAGLATGDDTFEERLRAVIRQQGSVLVALSGGVDSSLIAALAAQELGPNAVAATGVSASLSDQELESVRALCRQLGLQHVTVNTDELADPNYRANAPDRCYHCKTELYSQLAVERDKRGLARILDGTSAQDLGGHRPGHRAATEHAVLSPLVEVDADKNNVRRLARQLNLPNAERPSSPCLSSRIAYGVEVTPERLGRVGEAEHYLRGLGFKNVRVRLHDSIARIEVPKSDLELAAQHADAIATHLRSLGFVYVTLDLAGLRSGSLLEVINNPS